jgi:hypothetical protein
LKRPSELLAFSYTKRECVYTYIHTYIHSVTKRCLPYTNKQCIRVFRNRAKYNAPSPHTRVN